MTTSGANEEQDKPGNLVIRLIDPALVLLVKTLILMRQLRSRDPRESYTNVLRPDKQERVHIKGWQAVLEWPPERRVGCFAGVLIGTGIGVAVFWLYR